LYPAKIDFVDDILACQRVKALFFQPLKWRFTRCGVYFSIDLVTPRKGLSVQIVQRIVFDSDHEVVTDKLHSALHLALGLTTVWPAQNRFEPVKPRKVLKLPV
jgi:hypothetical protein